MDNQSKMILSFLAGATAGAAVTYLITSEKGEEMLNEIKDLASRVKDSVGERVKKATDRASSSMSDMDDEAIGI